MTIIRNCKDTYYQTYFKENKKNAIKIWKSIKEIIHIKSTPTSKPINLLINNTLITDQKQIATNFNMFFSNIAEKLNKKITKTNKNFDDYLNLPNANSFFIQPTTKEDIEDIISTMNIHKACGPNSIPTNILKNFKKILSAPLSQIINLSFSGGVFPDMLRIAKVIPVFKKGDPLECNNYRPISLLPNIGKIYEKLMHRRLTLFLRQNNSLFSYQFGFRNSYSTTHALISISEQIRTALDNNKFACGVFIDMQKAFDTVDHKILLSKLEYYGIRGIALNWFKSYLNNRMQYTVINDVKSESMKIKYGVPQGSVLGPLLFLLYINDLNKAITYSKIHHFADDTNILYPSHSLKDINKKVNFDLKNVVNWLRANRISLNVNKTEIIIFRSRTNKLSKNMNFRISGQKIEVTQQTKYLGIILDENLSFIPQLNNLKVKLNRANGLLSKIRHYVTTDLLRMIYFTLFDSHMRYGCQIWGQNNNELLNSIQRAQNKAMRIINFKSFKDHSEPLYKQMKILKLKDLVTFNNCIFAYDQLSKNLPNVFTEYFKPTGRQHEHNTRGAKNLLLDIPNVKTAKYGSNSIKVKSVTDWNNIINKLNYDSKSNKSKREGFIRALKTHLLDKYQLQ